MQLNCASDLTPRPREGDVRDDLGELDVVVNVGVDVVVEVVVDVLGIGTGLPAYNIEDQWGDNLDKTDLAIFWPGRSNFPPNFLRSKKFRNLGSDILLTGNSDSNKS